MLDSWHDGPTKSAIVDFVARVTAEGGPDFVAPAERVAVFDNEARSGARNRPTSSWISWCAGWLSKPRRTTR